MKEAANFSAETFITRATVNIVDIVEVLFAKRMFSAKKQKKKLKQHLHWQIKVEENIYLSYSQTFKCFRTDRILRIEMKLKVLFMFLPKNSFVIAPTVRAVIAVSPCPDREREVKGSSLARSQMLSRPYGQSENSNSQMS